MAANGGAECTEKAGGGLSGEDCEVEGAVQSGEYGDHYPRASFPRCNDADEHAKQRLMPIVRDLIQTAVIGISRHPFGRLLPCRQLS